MFAKVSSRIRRRSAGQKSLNSPTKPQEAVIQVDIAPALLRWSDFSSPFPSVTMGGYGRFYETYTTSESTESLRFCPLLSQQPEPSPSSEIPPKSPLFDALRRRGLPVIQEVSLESLSLNLKPRILTITTTTTQPHLLKRRQRQLLRTPSIERDFPLGSRCQSLSDHTTITFNTDATLTGTDTPPSPGSIFSSDSRSSHKRSDSNDSEYPITPATSDEDGGILSSEFFLSSTRHIESDSEYEPVTSPISPSSCCTLKILPGHESESVVIRPLSALSFCTARSDFSDS